MEAVLEAAMEETEEAQFIRGVISLMEGKG
jgi:hypothetical protein